MASTIVFPLPGTFFLSIIVDPLFILHNYDELSPFEGFLVSNLNSDFSFFSNSTMFWSLIAGISQVSCVKMFIRLRVFWFMSALFTRL